MVGTASEAAAAVTNRRREIKLVGGFMRAPCSKDNKQGGRVIETLSPLSLKDDKKSRHRMFYPELKRVSDLNWCRVCV